MTTFFFDLDFDRAVTFRLDVDFFALTRLRGLLALGLLLLLPFLALLVFALLLAVVFFADAA
ncbi:hypothetical protein D9M72_612000 [compost metagenome]